MADNKQQELTDEEKRDLGEFESKEPPAGGGTAEGIGRFARSIPGAARDIARGAWRAAITPPPPRAPQAPPRETMSAQPGTFETIRRTLTGESPYAYERTMGRNLGSPLTLTPESSYTPEGRAEHPIRSRLEDIGQAAKTWAQIPSELAPLIPGIGWEAPGRPGRYDMVRRPRATQEVEGLAQKVATAPQRPPIGSAEEDLDVAARRMFPGKTYGELSHEDQLRVMRTVGAEPPAERRRTVGQPPVAERRAAPRGTLTGERLHDVANIIEGAFNEPQPAAGPAPYTMAEAMGIRWAKTPGLPDISIPRNMPEGDIPGYVAEKQALQRQGVAGLPRTPSAPTPTPTATATPAPRPAAPAPSGETMPRTRPPAAPAPTTLGGGATMGQLPTEQQLAEEARRAGQMPKVTPPKEVP